MKLTDEQLQATLARALPPEDLATQSDAELEAMLDAEAKPTHAHHHGGSGTWGIAAAAGPPGTTAGGSPAGASRAAALRTLPSWTW